MVKGWHGRQGWKRGTAKRYKETFGSDRYVHYLDVHTHENLSNCHCIKKNKIPKKKKGIKYLVINLTNEVEDPYSENFKTLMEEI